MKDYVKRMIDEHSQLAQRLDALDNYVYSEKSDKDDKVEFANKCIQLAGMRQYEKALRARLENVGIVIVDGVYCEVIKEVMESKDEGSDNDIDKENE